MTLDNTAVTPLTSRDVQQWPQTVRSDREQQAGNTSGPPGLGSRRRCRASSHFCWEKAAATRRSHARRKGLDTGTRTHGALRSKYPFLATITYACFRGEFQKILELQVSLLCLPLTVHQCYDPNSESTPRAEQCRVIDHLSVSVITSTK